MKDPQLEEREEGKGQGAGKRSQKDANLDSGRLQVSFPSLISFLGAYVGPNGLISTYIAVKVERCDGNFREKWLCSHHNITA